MSASTLGLTSKVKSGSMNQMKQNSATIRLRDLLDRDDAWGRDEAKQVYPRFLDAVEKLGGADAIRISAEGIKNTDASFARETLFAAALRYRGTKVFCVVDLTNESMADNWDMAGLKMGIGIIWWVGDGYKFLGPGPSQTLMELFELAVKSDEGISTAYVHKKTGKELTNASTLLKQLSDKGYMVRREIVSPSGGKEFRYFIAK